jgi:hypothetical protein
VNETVKLAGLRVAPDLDAAGYVAGADRVEAANDGMAASANRAGAATDKVGDTLRTTAPRVSDAGNQMARLSHQYVDGYGTAVRFEKGVDSLARAIATGNATTAQAETILEGMYRKLGLMANATDLAEQGHHQLAAAVSTVNSRLALEEAAATGAAGAMQMLERNTGMAANQQRNLVFQLNDIGVSLAGGMNPLMVIAQQGSQIATIYGPDEGGLGRALQETGNLAVGLVTKFAPLLAVIGLGAGAIGGLAGEINKTSDVQVTFGDTALAVWQAFADGIYTLVEPALSSIGGWLGGLWDEVRPGLVALGNGIIGPFVGAFDAAKITWSAFPNVMGDIIIATVNNVIVGVESMINEAIALVNDFKAKVGLAGDIGAVEFGGVENPYEGATSGLAEGVVGAFSGAMNVDYLGGAFGAISGRAQTNARNRLAEEDDGAGQKAIDAYDKLIEKTQERILQMELEADTMGMVASQALQLTNMEGLLAEAEQTGVTLTEPRIEQLTRMATTMTDLQLTLDGLHIQLENRTPWEVMGEEIERLNELLAKGKIGADDYMMGLGLALETMVGDYANAGNNLIGNVEKITDAMGLEGKKAFDVQKGLGIARAVVAGSESIVHSFNAGSAIGGPPVGFAFAAVAAAATAAQIAAIASTTYQSKTPANATGGGSAAPAAAPQTGAHLTLVGSPGDRVSLADVGTLLGSINEHLSLQGKELTYSYTNG